VQDLKQAVLQPSSSRIDTSTRPAQMNYFSFLQLNTSLSTARDARLGSSGRAGHTQQTYDNGLQARSTDNNRWQSPSGWFPSRDTDVRWAGFPPGCLMIVIFVIGVSVCVSSGFALFVEYQNSCPEYHNSTSEGNIELAGQESSGLGGTGDPGSVHITSDDPSGGLTTHCEGSICLRESAHISSSDDTPSASATSCEGSLCQL
jgi:hypothetical protein